MAGCLISSLALSNQSAHARIETTDSTQPKQPVSEKINLSQRTLSFEANVGQTDARVKFLSRGHGYTVFLTPTEAVLSLRQKQDQDPAIVRMQMIEAKKNPEVTGEDKLRGTVNYFNGGERANWSSQVATYGSVKYHEIYSGVDLVYYGKQQQLEYDFIVAPNQDPQKIRLSFSGVQSLSIDQTGALVLKTDAGEIRQQPPVAYQEIDGRRQSVQAAYMLKKQGEVGFRVGDYDASKTLVIDPVIDYSTYLGGNGQEEGNDIAVDANGYLYVTGWTAAANFPVHHAMKATKTGTVEAFVTMICPSMGADSLVSSTYWGQVTAGSNTEGRAIALDSQNHVLVAGVTSAQNFPTTPGSLQPTFQPFSGVNGFLSKFDLSTGTLLYSTYLMGNGADEAADLTVGGEDIVYISGRTTSTNFPITLSNAYQTYNAGIFDGFVMKLSPSGSSPSATYSMRYSTYLGGFSDDSASNIAVDEKENVYLTGATQSRDLAGTPQYDGFPVMDAYQSNHGGGDDAFLSKIDTNGSGSASLVYSTYLGGSGSENAAVQLGGIALDPTTPGQVYVTGTTNSINFPLRSELDSTLGGYDVFVTKIDTWRSGDDSLVYSTFLGGAGLDYGTDIAVDSSGRVFVAGGTLSNDFPVQCGLANAPSWDGFVTMLEWGGSSIMFSTHLGADSYDQINAIAVDASGTAHVTGSTYSSNFPVVDGFQLAPGGFGDSFVTTITPEKCE
jgi:hypothetical protein